jgi:hypothetical protein
MTDFEVFIKANNLQKQAVAEYLGVSRAFITQLCQGLRELPSERLALIKANKSWDTSMLREGGSRISVGNVTARASGNGSVATSIGCGAQDSRTEEVAELRRQIDELKAQNARLLGIIEKLTSNL